MRNEEILQGLKEGYFKRYFFRKDGLELPLYLSRSHKNLINAHANRGKYSDTGKITIYPFFSQLTVSQKRFILAHEIAHIVAEDYYKIPFIHYFLWLPGVILIILGLLQTGVFLAFLGLVAFFFYPSMRSRVVEKRADREAVRACEPGDLREILILVRDYFGKKKGWLDSHPGAAGRIVYITHFFKKYHGETL